MERVLRSPSVHGGAGNAKPPRADVCYRMDLANSRRMGTEHRHAQASARATRRATTNSLPGTASRLALTVAPAAAEYSFRRCLSTAAATHAALSLLESSTACSILARVY